MKDVLKKAKNQKAVVITTYAAFTGFDDLYDFLKEASDDGVEVTFVPFGDKK